MKYLNFTVLFMLLAFTLQAQSNTKRKKALAKVERSIKIEKPSMAVDFNPLGNIMVSGGADNTIEVREVSGGKVLHSLEGHQEEINVLKCSPKGRLFLSGGADTKIFLWDLTTGRQISEFDGHEAPIKDLAFSPGGRFFASVSEDGKILITDAIAGVNSIEISTKEDNFSCVSYSPDGKQIVTGNEDGLVKIWEATTGKHIKSIKAHKNQINRIVWSKQADYIATAGDDKMLKIWDPATASLRASLKGHKSAIKKMDVDFSGMIIATGDKAGLIKLWDLTNERFLIDYQSEGMGQINGVAFTPDGQVLANVSNEKDIKFWKMPNVPKRIEIMTMDSLGQWITQKKGEDKKIFMERLKQKEAVKESIKDAIAANLILFYRTTTPWESDMTMNDYDSNQALFELESKVFGTLKMMVDPNDASKVVDKKKRMEIRELDLKFEKDNLELNSMTVYFRGLNRRYTITK